MQVAETTVYGPGVYTDANGKTECVVFVRQVTGLGPTQSWKRGKKIIGAQIGEIKRYTAIATFDSNGKYPTDNNGRHAAIYLSHDPHTKGIYVLDQFNKQGKVGKRLIHFWEKKNEKKSGQVYSRSNDSDTFYVIE
jgi:hypothetical protein